MTTTTSNLLAEQNTEIYDCWFQLSDWNWSSTRPPSTEEPTLTQFDNLTPTQHVHTADQGDAAPAPINIVIDKQFNEQQAGDDNALPSQPRSHPPNSVLLGLKEVNSKESSKTPQGGGTTNNHEPQKLTTDTRLNLIATPTHLLAEPDLSAV